MRFVSPRFSTIIEIGIHGSHPIVAQVIAFVASQQPMKRLPSLLAIRSDKDAGTGECRGDPVGERSLLFGVGPMTLDVNDWISFRQLVDRVVAVEAFEA